MELDYKLFIHKFHPIFFKDYDNENENEIIQILKTLIMMDNLNILLIGDIASGKTSLLNVIIREYYKGLPSIL